MFPSSLRILCVSLTVCLIVIGASSVVLAANTEVDVPSSTTDLATLGLATDSDVTFTNIAYPGVATFTNTTALSIGALNGDGLEKGRPSTGRPFLVHDVSPWFAVGGATAPTTALVGRAQQCVQAACRIGEYT